MSLERRLLDKISIDVYGLVSYSHQCVIYLGIQVSIAIPRLRSNFEQPSDFFANDESICSTGL